MKLEFGGGMKMDINIKEINPDMAFQYVEFFENRALEDGNINKGCYCVWHHWTEKHEYERSKLSEEKRSLCKKIMLLS